MPPRRRHRGSRLHRQPHGGPAGRARLRGRRHRQPRGRPRGEPGPAPRQSTPAVRRRWTWSTLPADSRAVPGRGLRVPLRRHRRHRARPSSARWTTCAPTSTARSPCWRRRATPACASSSTRPRRPATGSPPSCPPPRAPPIQPGVSVRAQQVARRVRGAPLGPGVPAAGQLDPDVQRVRAAGADHRRLRRGVRRVPGPEAPRQAASPWWATGRSGATSSTSPTWRAPSCSRPSPTATARSSTSAVAGNRRPSTGWWS